MIDLKTPHFRLLYQSIFRDNWQPMKCSEKKCNTECNKNPHELTQTTLFLQSPSHPKIENYEWQEKNWDNVMRQNQRSVKNHKSNMPTYYIFFATHFFHT